MGNTVKTFVKDVAKQALKGATSHVLGTYIPFVGTHIANYLNSKYAKGTFAIGEPEVEVPEDRKTKAINTPAQLKALVKEFPEEAKKAGLTVDMINEEVAEAKKVSKAVGGMINMNRKYYAQVEGNIPTREKLTPVKKMKAYAKGEHSLSKEKKPKKARTQAQIEATKRLVEANRKRREKK